MDAKRKYLVVMDVPAIKEYVFGTDRLVEIRGASARLDSLNRARAKECLEENLGKVSVECIYANGGGGQFILEGSDRGVRKALDKLKRKFSAKTGGALRLVCGTAEYDENRYRACLDKAFLGLKKEKEEHPFAVCSELHTSYIRECDSCSGMAAEPNEYADEKRLLCVSCLKKVEAGKDRGLWKDFYDKQLKNEGWSSDQARDARLKTFDDIGARCSARPGYVALVYADGNAMGRLIKSIDREKQYRDFSEIVDESIREACYEAIFQSYRDVHGKDLLPGMAIPCDILLLGGDDLMVYTTAEMAMPFAGTVARLFNEKTQRKFAASEDTFLAERLGAKGLTISFGIAYGKSHTPFSILFRQAEELLKLAKRAGSEDPRSQDHYSPTYIDYHLTSFFNQLRVKDCRSSHLQRKTKSGTLRFYQKPYALEDAKALLDHARKLVPRIPRSRLKRLGAIAAMGKWYATLEYLKIFLGTRKDENRRWISEAMNRFDCCGESVPWRKKQPGVHDGQEPIWDTMLIDLVELAEFIPNRSGREEGAHAPNQD